MGAPNASSERSRRPESGFTLIELLIVVAIIGIIAAIAVVNLQSALDKSRQRKTMATMRSVATAIQAYGGDHAHLPTDGISAQQLSAALSPQVYKLVETTDGWGFDLVYETDGDSYSLTSYGRDNGAGPAVLTRATKDQFDNDIVLVDGIFVGSPES